MYNGKYRGASRNFIRDDFLVDCGPYFLHGSYCCQVIDCPWITALRNEFDISGDEVFMEQVIFIACLRKII